ncbi:hypothetical protein FHS18_005639 [Paenibacillus phyllosphaerae]|uniref:Uncharacterized protein n=1 Tax=Paenibacillus phyllosphaerae TaxID=274593 RepID=A0A7W5B323_9BACL|nr:hypothetical protein [Paenibacillus phyllosphaerae]MBB3113527.1 hypothetical protein [Paenibacillus phyllosphaerae]
MSEEQFEMYNDPFKMLILLAQMAADEQGIPLDYANVPNIDNETFSMTNGKFVYKKDQTVIEWYEFLGRDITSNHDLTRTQYNKMFVDCMSSLYNS